MISNIPLETVHVAKVLGVQISSDLKWHTQVSEMLKKANGRLYMLKLLKRFNLPRDDLLTIFTGYVRPLAEYAAPVWHPGLTNNESAALERIQKRAFKIIMGKDYTMYEEVLGLCEMDTLSVRREQLCLKFFESLMRLEHFSDWVPPMRSKVHQRNLRNSIKISIPRCRTERCRKRPMVYMTNLWNKKSA
jgi:hypothetical protein